MWISRAFASLAYRLRHSCHDEYLQQVGVRDVSQAPEVIREVHQADDNWIGMKEAMNFFLRAADAIIAKTVMVNNTINLTDIASALVCLGKGREMTEMITEMKCSCCNVERVR